MQSLICRACAAVKLRFLARAVTSKTDNDNGSPLRRLLNDASAFGEVGAAVPAEGELQWATQPYATQPLEDSIPYVDPKETTIILFPGQGSQCVGMGRRLLEIAAAKDLYELASSIVGWDVGRVCREGPADELERRCQTAVVVTALAALERAREERPGAVERARAAAGFSLGEIAALVFADALGFEPALRLVELRSAAMNAAAAERAGGMLTVWLAPDARLKELLASARDRTRTSELPDPVCQIANYLFPGCKVLAGDEAALRFVEAEGRAWGVRRAARVRVAGAFHSPLMARAEEAVREALRLVEVRPPRLPVVSCVDARAARSSAGVRRRLARLTTAAVRWEQALHALYARPGAAPQPLTLALGPGGALRSSLKLVNARAWDASLQIDAWDVGRVCREGPADELERRCQTAVVVTALAALERAREERPGAVERARAAAGFSLGEIAALVFADALGFEPALRLVELRSAAMNAAAAERAGGMLTVWLAPDARLKELLASARDRTRTSELPDPVCQIANYLFPGCKVLAGDEAALRFVEAEGRAWGVRRAARVRVAGAFHSPLMARAEEAVREALRLVEVRPPRLPVVSCVDARAARSSAGVRRRLARLTTAAVRWEQALHALYARPGAAPQPLTLALGPGGALRSSLKLVNARAWDASLQIDA